MDKLSTSACYLFSQLQRYRASGPKGPPGICCHSCVCGRALHGPSTAGCESAIASGPAHALVHAHMPTHKGMCRPKMIHQAAYAD